MAEPFMGQISIVGFNFAPRGWAICDGRLLPIAQNTALFSLLGTTFGGDGRTTFGLPDLQGRAGVGVGTGPGLTPKTWGERLGVENVTLGLTEIASHTHNLGQNARVNGRTEDAGVTAPANNFLGAHEAYTTGQTAGNAPLHAGTLTGTTDNSGGGQQHNNMQPSLAMYTVIAITGLYPSRS